VRQGARLHADRRRGQVKDDYAQWVDEQKKKLAAAADDPNKVWELNDLVARRQCFDANCAACHQPTGTGKPRSARPRSSADKVVLGPKEHQIDVVLNGAEQRQDAAVEAAVRRRHRVGDQLHAQQLGQQGEQNVVQPTEVQDGAQRLRWSTMSSAPHTIVAGTRTPRHDGTRITRRDHALDHDDQPQGHRHAVPVVLVHDVHRRRLMALTIRAELFKPGLQIVDPEFFNSLTTLHG
jgi:mono/diheme cytochrome c family protein